MHNTELVQILRNEVANALDPEWIDEIWRSYYGSLKIRILNENPNWFLQWEPILRTMHVGWSNKVRKNYKELIDRSDGKYWKQIIKEEETGSPSLLPWDMSTSGTAVKHALHIAKFQDETGLQIKDMEHIFEFGGGYGSMRRLIHRIDFKGDYLIYDMPIMSALQRFYLGSLEIETRCVDRLEIAKDHVARFDPEKSIFIATSSLNEVPLDLRENVRKMLHEFKGILISFSHKLRNIDNLCYFTGWAEFMDHRWILMRLDASRDDRSYLFGVIE